MNEKTYTLNFTDVYHILPNGRAAAKFKIHYHLIDEKEETTKTIIVIITDVVCLNWGFPFWSYNPSVDFGKLIQVLIELAKEYIDEKLRKNSLDDNEKLVIASNQYPSTCPFDANKLEDLGTADYQFHKNSISLAE